MSTLKVNRIEPRTGDTVEIVGFEAGGGEGSIIQTVFFESEDLVSATSPVGWPNYTVFPGFEVLITPKKADSTLIVTFSGLYVRSTSLGSVLNILRTGTGVSDKFLHIPQNIVGTPAITPVASGYVLGFVAYDRPNTTQSVKYSLTNTVIDSASVGYLNKNQASTHINQNQAVSRLIVQEVSA